MKKRRAAAFLLTVFFASTYVTCTQAAEIPRAEPISEDEELSISVDLSIGGEPAADVGISLYQVADVEWDGGGVTYTALTGDAAYAGMTAEESSETAAELAESDLSGLLTLAGTTGADGEAYVQVTEPGMYLVVQDEAKDGYLFAPFLVPVPEAVEEDGVYVWNYQVVCEPKSAVLSASEYTETSGVSSTSTGTDSDGGAGTQTVSAGSAGSVKTGDEAELTRRIVLLAAALTGVALTAGIRRRATVTQTLSAQKQQS